MFTWAVPMEALKVLQVKGNRFERLQKKPLPLDQPIRLHFAWHTLLKRYVSFDKKINTKKKKRIAKNTLYFLLNK